MLSRLLTVAAMALTTAVACASPPYPTLTYLYTINITNGEDFTAGKTPTGIQNIVPIAGGSFAGPKLSGNITTGFDYGFVDNAGTFHPRAVYIMETDDGETIEAIESGPAPNIAIQFQTGSEKYAWLNTALAYASGGKTDTGVSLNVWQLTPPS